MDLAFFPSPVQELLREPRLMPLGPGSPNQAMRAKLSALDAAALGHPYPIQDPAMAQACFSGLWLWHDFLDESHRISQDLESVEGSYWHALMHRREPDFPNAAYWFRRVGNHPIFAALQQAALVLAKDGPPQAEFLARQPQWDPFAFVDFCEASYPETAAGHDLCRRIQRLEWELLFQHCHRRSIR